MEIKGFKVNECIYEGKNSTIWKAHQISLGRPVAIKVLKPEIAADPEQKADFLREARITARIKHTNLIQVYDISDEGNLCYYTMEYCGGPSVEQIIKEEKNLSNKMTLDIALQVAHALQCLWQEERMVHRNIKPGNILTTKDHTAKVCDFGLVKICSDGAQQDNETLAGTPNYMSPELAAGKDIDFRSDMYSLGTLIYHMLTGQAPFHDRSNADAVLEGQRKDQIVNPKELVSGTSVSTINLLSRLMMKSPDYRYKSWSEAIDSIDKAKKGRLFLMQKSQALSTIGDFESSRPSEKTKENTYKSEVFMFPLWLHAALLLILILWWTGSAIVLMREPVPASSEEAGPAFADISLDDTEENRQEPSVPADSVSENNDSGDVAGKRAGRPIEPETEEPPAENAEFSQPTENTELVITPELITKVVEGKFAEALSSLSEKSVAQESKEEDRLKAMQEAMRKLSSIDSKVAQAFAEKVGLDVTINHGGKEIPVTIKSVINNMIVAETVGKNEREVTFPVSRLEPSEKVRWLGRARSDADHAVRFFLYAMDGNKDKAERHASESGSLSGPLNDFLTAR